MITSSSICRVSLGVWTWTANCYYSKYNRWVGNGVKISKEECLVRHWSLFSSVKLQIVSIACHSLRLCWVENESQEWSKQLETDVRDINDLPKWKKTNQRAGLEAASTSWKCCINPWWYEGITCDGPDYGRTEITLSSSQRDRDIGHHGIAAAVILRCEITGRMGLTVSWVRHHQPSGSIYRVKAECKRLCSPNWPLLVSLDNRSNYKVFNYTFC